MHKHTARCNGRAGVGATSQLLQELQVGECRLGGMEGGRGGGYMYEPRVVARGEEARCAWPQHQGAVETQDGVTEG